MGPFRHHVIACEQKKPDGQPCCAARGATAVIDALRREVGRRGLQDQVLVTASGSMGLCEHGPNLVVYPDGVWYSGVTADDVPEIVTEHLMGGRPVERLARRDVEGLRQEIAGNRARMMAAMAARDRAGVVPDDLQAMVRGFMDSRVVLTALELDLFTAVKDGATAAQAAQAAGSEPRATALLLNALCALGLCKKEQEVFRPSPVAERFLVSTSPDEAVTALKHNLSLWERWSTLTARVRGEAPQVVEMTARGDAWTVPFIAAMHRNAALRAPLVVNAVGTEGVRRVLDVGGGSGAYSIAFARASADLHAEVLDLATVTPLTTRYIQEAGLVDRVTTRVGDLRRDALGEGYDLVLISAICHMLDPEQNRDLLRRAYAALTPGGRVVIQDHVLDADRTGPRAGAGFAINMLVGTQGGDCYVEQEYADWLTAAGFGDVRRMKIAGPTELMVAERS